MRETGDEVVRRALAPDLVRLPGDLIQPVYILLFRKKHFRAFQRQQFIRNSVSDDAARMLQKTLSIRISPAKCPYFILP